MPKKILFSDDVHINTRNFKSLHEYIASQKMRIVFCEAGRNLWNRYGHYEDVEEIRDIVVRLRHMEREKLREMTGDCCGTRVNLFKVCQAEILSRVLAEDERWFGQNIPRDEAYIFDKLFEQNHDVLTENMAAALRWCDLYSEFIDPKGYVFSVIFSGSQIYQKILMQILKLTRTRAFVVEAFQTGTEYYFEEKYSPIANNSDSRWPTVLNAARLPDDFSELHREYLKAMNKILMANNKNVVQPQEPLPEDILTFLHSKQTVMLACQVQNDFSLIENRSLSEANPLKIYEQLLRLLLERTSLNILVKTHPWERKKTNLRSSFTYEHLSTFIASLDRKAQSRIRLVEDININAALQQAHAFITLNSQSALEACFHGGMKPFTLGQPFYGGYGFTNDFSDDEALVEALASGSHAPVLDLESYEDFRNWYTRMLQRHLVCVHSSGVPNLRAKLSEPNVITLADNRPYVSQFSEEAKPAQVINEIQGVRIVKLDGKEPAPANSNTTSAGMNAEGLSKKEIFRRKIRKLKRNPEKYLKDSRHSFLRFAGHLFY